MYGQVTHGHSGFGARAPGPVSLTRGKVVCVQLTGSSNWTVPGDALGPCEIYVWGPGGAGRNGNLGGVLSGGGSGALGIFTSKIIAPGQVYAYVAGTPGNASTFMGGSAGFGGTGGDGVGGTGGTASGFDTNITGAVGGVGVQNATAGAQASNGVSGTNSTSNGGYGGVAIGPSAQASAGGGGAGAPSPTSGPQGGPGGAGGSATRNATGDFGIVGQAGMLPGGGGGGGSVEANPHNGGAGANGLILIFYLSNT